MKPWKIIALIVLVLAGCARQEPKTQRAVAPTLAVVGDTGSMRPTLNGGEPLFIAEWPFEDVRVGDIVVVWWEARERNVIHRVIALKYDGGQLVGLVTKGDANPVRDPYLCTRENFVGKALFSQVLRPSPI